MGNILATASQCFESRSIKSDYYIKFDSSRQKWVVFGNPRKKLADSIDQNGTNNEVLISGAEWENANGINGAYRPTGELCNGATVYKKMQGPAAAGVNLKDYWVEYNSEQLRWFIRDSSMRGSTSVQGFAYISCSPAKPIEQCKKGNWRVFSSTVQSYLLMPSIKVNIVTLGQYRVTISGAQGTYAEIINGKYVPTEELHNGASVYRKSTDKTCYIEYDCDQTIWCVRRKVYSSVMSSAAVRMGGWAFQDCPPGKPLEDSSTGDWYVFDGENHTSQPSVVSSLTVLGETKIRIKGGRLIMKGLRIDECSNEFPFVKKDVPVKKGLLSKSESEEYYHDNDEVQEIEGEIYSLADEPPDASIPDALASSSEASKFIRSCDLIHGVYRPVRPNCASAYKTSDKSTKISIYTKEKDPSTWIRYDSDKQRWEVWQQMIVRSSAEQSHQELICWGWMPSAPSYSLEDCDALPWNILDAPNGLQSVTYELDSKMQVTDTDDSTVPDNDSSVPSVHMELDTRLLDTPFIDHERYVTRTPTPAADYLVNLLKFPDLGSSNIIFGQSQLDKKEKTSLLPALSTFREAMGPILQSCKSGKLPGTVLQFLTAAVEVVTNTTDVLLVSNFADTRMTKDQLSALLMYTFDSSIPYKSSLYYLTNVALRSDNKDDVTPFKGFIHLLLNSMQSLPPATPNTVVYSGRRCSLTLFRQGMIVVMAPFTSFTFSRDLIFSDEVLGPQELIPITTILIVTLTTGQARLLQGTGVSALCDEAAEVILPMKTRFLVTSIVNATPSNGNRKEVYLKQLPEVDPVLSLS